MLSLTGEQTEAEAFIRQVQLPERVDWIGPTHMEDGRHRYLLFFGYAQAEALVGEIRRIRRTHSAQPAGRAPAQRGLRIAVDDVDALQI